MALCRLPGAPRWAARLLVLLLFFRGSPNAHAVEPLTLLTYNCKGNGIEDWSTHSAQVQAIGRQRS
jgi:hypothetical protein